MQIDVVPEPAPEERQALVEALEAFTGSSTGPDVYLSPWRRAGFEADDDHDARRPC